MRIEKLKFGNFKCFKNIELELGKLTLLTGANSSGKSSVIYGILAALQSGEFPFQFSPNGKYVDMGGFLDISHKHNKNNLIKINFTIKNNETYEIETTWEQDKLRNLPNLKSLTITANYYILNIANRTKNYNLKFEYFSNKDPKKDYYTMDLKNKVYDFVFNGSNEKKIIDEETYKRFKRILKPGQPVTELSFTDFSELNYEFIVDNGNTPLYIAINQFKTIWDKTEKSTNYISSFRLHPERTYYEQTKTDLKVGKFGERYTDQIVLWEAQKANEYTELIKILNKIDLLSDIKTKRIEGGRYELQVKPMKKSAYCSLADVGFGISQFLPILVADFQLGDNSFLFVSQPEIHLHPSIQASFADYLIEQIKTTNKTYIIETHSEYLLNRIRLAIVKGDIPENDIKTYYFRNNGEEVESFKLLFTPDGQIKNAPEDFFTTYMIDVMDIAINAAK